MRPGMRISILLMLCLSATVCAHGQAGGDFHTRDDQARRLYALSAFAHGHRHGYEEGYLVADTEIHVGRLQRTLREKDVPKANYRKEYGSRKQFQLGFSYGFLAGYKDSFAGRKFRLVEWSAQIPPFAWMAELPQADEGREPDAGMRVGFEDGMAQGYESGMRMEPADADAQTLADQAARKCGEQPGKRREGYCEGYTQGFLLGANDHQPTPLAAPMTAPGLAQNHSQPQ